MTETKKALRERQLREVLAVLEGHPGQTAYMIGTSMSARQPESAAAAAPVPLTLVISLLGELAKAGLARSEHDPKGERWHPAVPQKRQEAT